MIADKLTEIPNEYEALKAEDIAVPAFSFCGEYPHIYKYEVSTPIPKHHPPKIYKKLETLVDCSLLIRLWNLY